MVRKQEDKRDRGEGKELLFDGANHHASHDGLLVVVKKFDDHFDGVEGLRFGRSINPIGLKVRCGIRNV